MINVIRINCLISENCDNYRFGCRLCKRNKAIPQPTDNFKANTRIKERLRVVKNDSK